MNVTVYHILHVSSLFLLAGLTFSVFANPDPSRRSKVMMIGGFLSLLVLVSGFGLLARLHYSFLNGWVLVKFVAWLGLASFSGAAFRKREAVPTLRLIVAVLIVAAVTMVYTKPF
ncbi:MAG TPA: hypothetical protein ENJ09_01725 [Planctomycetes bacterium]|nr:hypothetical protein [Planctomycetota bacterium]